jgi:hypothetical protein
LKFKKLKGGRRREDESGSTDQQNKRIMLQNFKTAKETITKRCYSPEKVQLVNKQENSLNFQYPK